MEGEGGTLFRRLVQPTAALRLRDHHSCALAAGGLALGRQGDAAALAHRLEVERVLVWRHVLWNKVSRRARTEATCGQTRHTIFGFTTRRF